MYKPLYINDITDKMIDEAIDKLSSLLNADKLNDYYIRFLSKDDKYGKYLCTYGDYHYFTNPFISPKIELLLDNYRSVFDDDFFKQFIIRHNITLLDRVAQIMQYGFPNLDNVYDDLETTMNIDVTISVINIKKPITQGECLVIDHAIKEHSSYEDCDIWLNEDIMLEPAKSYKNMIDFLNTNNYIE